jgi:hypothetical protein
MGYWSTDAEGNSFSDNPGEKLIWGDAPADDLDQCLHEVYDMFGGVPSRVELDDMFTLATQGAGEAPVVLMLQVGLSHAIDAFHADWDRDPSMAELRAGFLFSTGDLEAARERFAARTVLATASLA